MSHSHRSEQVRLDGKTIDKVATLARLHLGNDEKVRLAGEVSEVLAYVKRLQQVDVSGVEPMAHPADAIGEPRPDVETPGLPREAALSNAPKHDGETFLVPQILDAT